MSAAPKFAPGKLVRHTNGHVFAVLRVSRMFLEIETSQGAQWWRKREFQPEPNQ